MLKEPLTLTGEEIEQLIQEVVANINMISYTAEKTFLILAVLIAELTKLMQYIEEEQNFPETLITAVYEAASLQYIPGNSMEYLCSTTIH